MDEKQKKIIMRCWEVLLFVASLVMLILGLIKIAKPELLNISTGGGIALAVLGQITLTPNTIIAMWIRQIMNRKHRDKIKNDVEEVLEQNGINITKPKKQSKKPIKNEPEEEKITVWYGK